MKLAGMIVALACVAMPAADGQTSDQHAESKMHAMENLKLQAYRAKDFRTLDKLLDNRFVAVAQDGETRSKVKELLMVKESDSLQYIENDMVIRMHGNTTIVTGLYEIRRLVHGSTSAERGRFIDTWLNREGQWVMISSLCTPAK
jgi:hypothetical protein